MSLAQIITIIKSSVCLLQIKTCKRLKKKPHTYFNLAIQNMHTHKILWKHFKQPTDNNKCERWQSTLFQIPPLKPNQNLYFLMQFFL